LSREPSARRACSSSRRSWITVTSAGCRDPRGVAAGRSRQAELYRTALSRQRRSPAAKRRAGHSELVSETNVSQPADPQGPATVVALGHLARRGSYQRRRLTLPGRQSVSSPAPLQYAEVIGRR
jgi:hypothetical protein